MNIVRGRARRPDDWPSSHVRARSDLSDRLDFSLEADEAAWLETHLAACPDCRSIAAAYAAQRLELRALLDRNPTPPRDLWARTAAAIEAESRFRDRGARASGWSRRRLVAPSALLAAALVVAVAVGTLTSSQLSPGAGGARSSDLVAVATASLAGDASTPIATRIPVTQKIAYVVKDPDGTYSIKTKNVDKVCPSPSTDPCDDANPTVDRKIDLDQTASTVFGSPDDARLIVVHDATSPNSGTISVVPLGSEPPASPTASPAVTASTAASSGPTATPTSTATARATPTRNPGSPPPSATPIPSDTATPAPSVAITPTPNGAIEIAHDVVLVGQSAAYSATGDWFAFTARPTDGSTGPDIFVWRVGDARATRVTGDHRSVFGSWAGESIVGSTLVAPSTDGASATTDLAPASFVLDPTTAEITALPQSGRAWRPAVDPTGRRAVYWAGSVRAVSTTAFAPGSGRLVIGDWSVATPSGSPAPTSPGGNQGAARHETTIVAGGIDDWDARWDTTGTHLAVWIADTRDPRVGRLSLYAVDSFDGKIDLKAPLLKGARAVAGYSIANGQLVWAEPPADGATTGRIQLLAWTDDSVGVTSTITGPVIVIR